MTTAPVSPVAADRLAAAESGRRLRALKAIAQARVGNAWLRLASCAIVAVVATSVLGHNYALAWFAGLVLVLLADRAIYQRILKRSDTGQSVSRLAPLIAWTVFQSVYGNAIAAMLYFAKYVHGETLAIIYIMGGVANAAATLRMSTPLAIAGAGPTVAFLVGLPLIDYLFVGARNELDLMPLIGALTLLAFGINLWKSLLASDAAQAQAEAAVLRERQAAAAAAAAKSDAIRRMNDELRTPMAALVGAAEHLRRAAVSAEAKHHIGALVQAGEVLRLVLDDLSDLDRLENGDMKIDLKPVDPRELAKAVVGAFRASAHDKGLELFLDVSHKTPALVSLDPLRVRQVMFNLIANAVRYTRNGGVRVRVQAQACDAPNHVRLAFIVADTGLGMSRSQMATVFNRSRVTSEGEGPGLGLAISLRLAQLMGGRIAAKSELGEGSVFSFIVDAPVIKAADEPDASAA
ncbi:MAG: sensor histidine kinase [Hyphomonadaceae bacterium]